MEKCLKGLQIKVLQEPKYRQVVQHIIFLIQFMEPYKKEFHKKFLFFNHLEFKY